MRFGDFAQFVRQNKCNLKLWQILMDDFLPFLTFYEARNSSINQKNEQQLINKENKLQLQPSSFALIDKDTEVLHTIITDVFINK